MIFFNNKPMISRNLKRLLGSSLFLLSTSLWLPAAVNGNSSVSDALRDGIDGIKKGTLKTGEVQFISSLCANSRTAQENNKTFQEIINSDLYDGKTAHQKDDLYFPDYAPSWEQDLDLLTGEPKAALRATQLGYQAIELGTGGIELAEGSTIKIELKDSNGTAINQKDIKLGDYVEVFTWDPSTDEALLANDLAKINNVNLTVIVTDTYGSLTPMKNWVLQNDSANHRVLALFQGNKLNITEENYTDSKANFDNGTSIYFTIPTNTNPAGVTLTFGDYSALSGDSNSSVIAYLQQQEMPPITISTGQQKTESGELVSGVWDSPITIDFATNTDVNLVTNRYGPAIGQSATEKQIAANASCYRTTMDETFTTPTIKIIGSGVIKGLNTPTTGDGAGETSNENSNQEIPGHSVRLVESLEGIKNSGTSEAMVDLSITGDTKFGKLFLGKGNEDSTKLIGSVELQSVGSCEGTYNNTSENGVRMEGIETAASAEIQGDILLKNSFTTSAADGSGTYTAGNRTIGDSTLAGTTTGSILFDTSIRTGSCDAASATGTIGNVTASGSTKGTVSILNSVETKDLCKTGARTIGNVEFTETSSTGGLIIRNGFKVTDENSSALTRADATIGNLVLNGTQNAPVLIDNSFRTSKTNELLSNETGATNHKIGAISLGGTLNGNITIDNGLHASGSIGKKNLTQEISSVAITGSVTGTDVGTAVSIGNGVWLDLSSTAVDEGHLTEGTSWAFSIPEVTVRGTAAIQATNSNASTTGLMIDNAFHANGSGAITTGDDMAEDDWACGSIGKIQLLDTAAITATSTTGKGVAAAIYGANTQGDLGREETSNILVKGTSDVEKVKLTGSEIGLLCDASIAKQDAFNLQLENTSIEGTNEAAILCHHTNIVLKNGVELKGAAAIKMGAGTYGINNGTVQVTETGTTSLNTKIGTLSLGKAALNLDVQSSDFVCDKPIEVSNLTQTNAEIQNLKFKTTAPITIGGQATVTKGTFEVSGETSKIVWDLTTIEEPQKLAFDATEMDKLSIQSIDASGVKALTDETNLTPVIEIKGFRNDKSLDPYDTYIQGKIIGNNSKHDADGTKFVGIDLSGDGGTIGEIENIGTVTITNATNNDIWTIEGNSSISSLIINKGKLVQKGRLTIWGDMELLGCDIEWENTTFNGGIYAPEDTIHAKPGTFACIRNGFTCDPSELSQNKPGDRPTFKGEGVMLDGTAAFQVDPEAAVTFQIANVSPSVNSPVAIRVAMTDEESDREAAPYGRSKTRNVIDLSNSLDIQYYDHKGKIYSGTGVAIQGTPYSKLELKNGTADKPNHLRGVVNQVGKIDVSGQWKLTDGIRNGGHLTLHQGARLDLGTSLLDVQSLTFCVDPHRLDAYLLCGGLLRDTVVEMCFNNEILINPEAQRYLLISGLTNAATAQEKIHHLNVGGFQFDANGDEIYVSLAADAAVNENNPRKIYYLGGYVRPDSETIPATDDCIEESTTTAALTEKEEMVAQNNITDLPETAPKTKSEEPVVVGCDLIPEVPNSSLRENETPPDVDPSNGGGSGEETVNPDNQTPADTPKKNSFMAWSAQQVDVVHQQMIQLRKMLSYQGFEPLPEAGEEGYNPYIQPIGSFSERKKISKDGLMKVKNNRYGALLGAQKVLPGGIFLQGGLGYVMNDAKFVEANQEPKLKTKSFVAGIAAAMQYTPQIHIRAVLAGSVDKYEYDRTFSNEEMLHAKFDGYTLGGAIQAIYVLPYQKFLVGPTLEISYDHIHQDEYNVEEKLKAEKYGAKFARVRLGLQFEQDTSLITKPTPYRFYGSINWVKTPYRRGGNSNMQLGESGEMLATDNHMVSREAWEGRLGARAKLQGGWNLDAAYDVTYQSDYLDHSFSVQCSRQF